MCIAKSVWAVDYRGHVSHWDGSNWSSAMQVAANQGGLTAISGIGAADALAVGLEYPAGTSSPSQAMAYRLSGNNWVPDPVSQLQALESVWEISGSDVWVVGSDAQGGAVAHKGTSAFWSTAPVGSGIFLSSLWAGGPTDIWAVGSGSGQGAAFHWTNNASLGSAAMQPITGTSGLIHAWGSGTGDVWSVGYVLSTNSAVLVYWPSGFSSTATVFPVSGLGQNILRSIWGSGSSDVWAVGDGKSIVHWTTGPSSTPAVVGPGDPTVGLSDIWGSGPNDVWAVGSAGSGGLAIHWTGTAWSTPIPLPGAQEVRAVWGVAR